MCGECYGDRRCRDAQLSAFYHDPGPTSSGIDHHTIQSHLSVGDDPVPSHIRVKPNTSSHMGYHLLLEEIFYVYNNSSLPPFRSSILPNVPLGAEITYDRPSPTRKTR